VYIKKVLIYSNLEKNHRFSIMKIAIAIILIMGLVSRHPVKEGVKIGRKLHK
jgi:hypothetical protein